MAELKYDFREYLIAKAEKAGCGLTAGHYTTNADRITFSLLSGDGKRRAPISISGLEEMQNANRESIQNLLDDRFDVALATVTAGD